MQHHIPMNRRQFFGVAGGVLTAAIAGWPVSQSAAAVPDSDLLKVLDNALWIPDGPPSARHLYVLAAPWCGYCQALYQQTRQRPAGVQLRWIETAGRDAASTSFAVAASLARDPRLLAQMYGTPRQPPPVLRDPRLTSNVQRYNFGIEQTISRVRFGEAGRVSFPTLVLQTSTDTAILSGLPQDLPSLLARLTPRPAAADIAPSGPGIVARPWQAQPTARRSYFARRDDMPALALPSAAAPILTLYGRHQGYTGYRQRRKRRHHVDRTGSLSGTWDVDGVCESDGAPCLVLLAILPVSPAAVPTTRAALRDLFWCWIVVSGLGRIAP